MHSDLLAQTTDIYLVSIWSFLKVLWLVCFLLKMFIMTFLRSGGPESITSKSVVQIQSSLLADKLFCVKSAGELTSSYTPVHLWFSFVFRLNCCLVSSCKINFRTGCSVFFLFGLGFWCLVFWCCVWWFVWGFFDVCVALFEVVTSLWPRCWRWVYI